MNFHDALSTGSTATTSRRNKDSGFAERSHELTASGNFDFLLAVDHDFDGASVYQLIPREKDDPNQSQNDGGENKDAKENGSQHNFNQQKT